jgi:ABC-type nitrate/sulfonate/bicarbonate transport system substrate-binding protein
MTLAEAGVSFSNLAFYIAQSEGYFKQHGIIMKIEELASSAATDALVGGSVQLTAVSVPSLVKARAKGIPELMVMQLAGLGLQTVVSKSWATAHHMSPSQPLCTNVRALSGITFGYVGSTDQGLLDWYLHQCGMSQSSVHTVMLSNDSTLATALKTGEIGAFSGSPPGPTSAAALDGGSVVINTQDIPAAQNQTYAGVVTTSSYASGHQTALHDLVLALRQAMNFYAANKQATVQLLKRDWFTTDSTSLITSALKLQTLYNQAMTSPEWSRALSFWSAGGVIPSDSKVQEGVDWTNSYWGS